MPVITEDYRVQQAALHAACPEYGVASAFFAPAVARIVKDQGVTELLDYGAGKERLGRELARLLGEACPPMRHYEPAVPEWASAPAPADMVACIDVLEHVEMDCLDDVLEDLARVAVRLGLFIVHNRPRDQDAPGRKERASDPATSRMVAAAAVPAFHASHASPDTQRLHGRRGTRRRERRACNGDRSRPRRHVPGVAGGIGGMHGADTAPFPDDCKRRTG